MQFLVVKIGRESNKVAHDLATVARSLNQDYFGLGHVPPIIADVVTSDAVNALVLS